MAGLMGKSSSAACRRRPLVCRLQSQAQARTLRITTRCQDVPSLTTAAAARELPSTSRQVPSYPCRTRFAPSPTGSLHCGSLRTALYNYLLAKASGGQFILRIEDTDQARHVEGAEQQLMEDLRWAGLSWDEGPDIGGDYGPYKQSQRLKVYDKHITMLLAIGKAYRCFCPPEDQPQQITRDMAESHQQSHQKHGRKSECLGTCREISDQESEDRALNGERFAVRFKTRRPPQEPIRWHDLVYGARESGKTLQPDIVIRKSDGFPSYHFANVVDDRLMGITHVIRGAEWLNFTNLHAEIYEAFDWEPPQFAHAGLLVDVGRQKLSKRTNTAGLEWFKKHHIIPAAAVNFVALLGWDPRQKLEGRGQAVSQVMDLDDMVKNFSLNFTKGEIMINIKKLQHLQDSHRKKMVAQQLDIPSSRNELLDELESMILDPSSWVGETTLFEGEPELTPCLKYMTADQPSMADDDRRLVQGREYLLRLLRADVGRWTTGMDDFVRHHKFMIWKPPRVHLRKKVPVSDGELLVEEKACSLRDAVGFLIDVTLSHQASLWDKKGWGVDDAGTSLSELLEAYRKVQHGFSILRWAILGGDAGLSMTAAMSLLGRRESLRRLNVARFVASKWKADMAANAVEVDPEVETPDGSETLEPEAIPQSNTV